ncbi:hypothetical protein [Mobilicoccus caccae]|uniref:Heavy metal transporter n=1 Tax=Mobilicoccus caccae TaxID=1859295 RepID=A0ABQ6IN38_9MICO|nr:hypothetical protein [Mobilicoccus caccae]GMA38841.1 hypothetical protein GCM10025883_08860 [Mobilicoccus caccae]
MPTDSSREERRRRRRFGCIVTSILMVVALILGTYGVGSYLVPRLSPRTCRVEAGGESVTYTPEQTRNAATVAAIGVREGLPRRAVTIALATAMQESKLRNLDHGDRDSLGLFQQRPSQGWGTPAQLQDTVYATEAFYERLVRVRGYLDRPLTEVAQDVQRSGFPDAYAQHEPLADLLAGALTGQSPAALTCRLDDASTSMTASQVAADIKEQVGVSPAVTGEGLVAVLSSPELAWTVAHWAVAHADRTGVGSVSVGSKRWSRGLSRTSSQWLSHDTDAGPNEVRISFSS